MTSTSTSSGRATGSANGSPVQQILNSPKNDSMVKRQKEKQYQSAMEQKANAQLQVGRNNSSSYYQQRQQTLPFGCCVLTFLCKIMRFSLASLSLIKGHVKLGLIGCRIRYPHSRVRSIRNMVRLHLLFDCSHVFIFLPFIPVIFTDYFWSFRCLWTDTYRGQNGCLSYTGHSIYIQEEFIAICLVRVILDDPTGVVNQEVSCSRDKFLLLPFTLK